jgi:hypothetical protein
MQDKYHYDTSGNIKLTNTCVNGRITQNVNTGGLTLRLFLTKEQKSELLLQSGELKSIKVVVL